MPNDDLAERWKPAPQRSWLSPPETIDHARAVSREGVLVPFVYALLGFWTIVGSSDARPIALALPAVIVTASVIAGVAMWWKQATWAAGVVVVMAFYFCLIAALPLLRGAFNFDLLLHVGLLLLAGRAALATTKLSKLKRQTAAYVSAATFD